MTWGTYYKQYQNKNKNNKKQQQWQQQKINQKEPKKSTRHININFILACITKRIGKKNTKTLLSTVNIFHHFINPEILETELPLSVGWLSELERSWNGAVLVIHVLDQGYFKCFDIISEVHRFIYCTIPVCKLLHRSRTCRLIIVINKP